jgi:hypothetical protein
MKIADKVEHLAEVGSVVIDEARALDAEAERIAQMTKALNARREQFIESLIGAERWTRDECRIVDLIVQNDKCTCKNYFKRTSEHLISCHEWQSASSRDRKTQS